MTKICTLLELSLVVKKSYCDLGLKSSSQQYFNMISARRFTALHKPLAHRTHCWSFPRATTMASFPPATNTLQRAANDCTILSKPPFYRFDDSSAIFFVCCWLRFRRTCHLAKFRCFSNIQVRSRHESSRTWLVWFLMAKNLLALMHEKSSLRSCGLYFFQETDWRTIINWNHLWEKKVRLRKCSLNENCFSRDDLDRSLFPFTVS